MKYCVTLIFQGLGITFLRKILIAVCSVIIFFIKSAFNLLNVGKFVNVACAMNQNRIQIYVVGRNFSKANPSNQKKVGRGPGKISTSTKYGAKYTSRPLKKITNYKIIQKKSQKNSRNKILDTKTDIITETTNLHSEGIPEWFTKLSKLIYTNGETSLYLKGFCWGLFVLLASVALSMIITVWPQHDVTLFPEYWYEPLPSVLVGFTAFSTATHYLLCNILMKPWSIFSWKILLNCISFYLLACQ